MRTTDIDCCEPGPSDLAADLDGCFERLVRAYQDRLYGFALRILGSPRDAEEAAQDAFVRAYRALKGYEAERVRALVLKPWLYQIALNVCRNRLRGRGPALVSLEKARDEDGEEGLDPPEDGEQRPEQVFERNEESERVAGLVRALPARYRVAVVLRYAQDLSYAEISEVLGQPVGTAKSNVHRGVSLLRAALVRLEETEQDTWRTADETAD